MKIFINQKFKKFFLSEKQSEGSRAVEERDPSGEGGLHHLQEGALQNFSLHSWIFRSPLIREKKNLFFKLKQNLHTGPKLIDYYHLRNC